MLLYFRFYQYVLKSEILFDDAGNLRNDQTAAIFHNLPSSALLTLIMDTPQRWMIEAVGSNQDLDNIFLESADQMVYGDFQLQNIIIEGLLIVCILVLYGISEVLIAEIHID